MKQLKRRMQCVCFVPFGLLWLCFNAADAEAKCHCACVYECEIRLWIYICDFHTAIFNTCYFVLFSISIELVVVKQPLFAFLTCFDLSQRRACLYMVPCSSIYVLMFGGWLTGSVGCDGNALVVLQKEQKNRNALREAWGACIFSFLFVSYFLFHILAIAHRRVCVCVSLSNYFDGFFIFLFYSNYIFTAFSSRTPHASSLAGWLIRRLCVCVCCVLCMTMIKFEHIMWAQRQHYHLTYFSL